MLDDFVVYRPSYEKGQHHILPELIEQRYDRTDEATGHARTVIITNASAYDVSVDEQRGAGQGHYFPDHEVRIPRRLFDGHVTEVASSQLSARYRRAPAGPGKSGAEKARAVRR